MLKCRNMANKCSSFYKIMHHDFEINIRLPPKFVNQVKCQLGNSAWLQGPCDLFTKVDVCYKGKAITFENGWEEFVYENFVEYGDLLLFHYKGNSHFVVAIYDTTCCEKEIAFQPPNITENLYDSKCNRPRNAKEDLQTSIRNQSHPPRGHKQVIKLSKVVKKRRDQVEKLAKDFQPDKGAAETSDSSTDDIGARANSYEDVSESLRRGFTNGIHSVRNLNDARGSPDTYFDVTMKKMNAPPGSRLSFPSAFSSIWIHDEIEEVRLVGPNERKWKGSIRRSKEWCYMNNPWGDIYSHYRLKMGDTCHFELIEEKPLTLRFTIERCSVEKLDGIRHSGRRFENKTENAEDTPRQEQCKTKKGFQGKECITQEANTLSHVRKRSFPEFDIISSADDQAFPKRKKLLTARPKAPEARTKPECFRGDREAEVDDFEQATKLSNGQFDEPTKDFQHKEIVENSSTDDITEGSNDSKSKKSRNFREDLQASIRNHSHPSHHIRHKKVAKVSKGVKRNTKGQFDELVEGVQHGKGVMLSNSSTDDIGDTEISSEDDLESLIRHDCANGIKSKRNIGDSRGGPKRDFKVIMKKSHGPPSPRLYFPTAFSQDWIHGKVNRVVLLGPEGREWKGSVRRCRDWGYMRRPWGNMYSHYKLKMDDTCHFKMVKKNPFTLRVTIKKCMGKGDGIRQSENRFKRETESWKDFQGNKGITQEAKSLPHGKKRSFVKFNNSSTVGDHAFSNSKKLRTARHQASKAKLKSEYFNGDQEAEMDEFGQVGKLSKCIKRQESDQNDQFDELTKDFQHKKCVEYSNPSTDDTSGTENSTEDHRKSPRHQCANDINCERNLNVSGSPSFEDTMKKNNASPISRPNTEKAKKTFCQEKWEPGKDFEGKKGRKGKAANILSHSKKRSFPHLKAFSNRENLVTAKHQSVKAKEIIRDDWEVKSG